MLAALVVMLVVSLAVVVAVATLLVLGLDCSEVQFPNLVDLHGMILHLVKAET